jgi:hypothetical protein
MKSLVTVLSITLEEIRHYARIVDGRKANVSVGTELAKLAKKHKGVDPVADIRQMRSEV